MFTLHLFLKYFITQRIVSGDFGGEVHLWDLRSKDGKFEVVNHRKWECHKVGSKANLTNRATRVSTVLDQTPGTLKALYRLVLKVISLQGHIVCIQLSASRIVTGSR